MNQHAASLSAEFIDFLHELNVSKTSRPLIAVSGGLDSMVLLHLLTDLPAHARPELHVAHLNHGLRGREGDLDQSLVESACEQLRQPFHTKTLVAGQISGTRKQSIEEAARSIRYAWLERIAVANRLDVILTAHHADDQVETVVHNLLRGTGLRGIQGMRIQRCLKSGVKLVRPLLSVSRRRLREYAESQQIAFREDSTNTELTFTRNRLRHQVLPVLKEQGGVDVANEVLQLAKSAAEATELLDELSQQVAAACIVTRTDNHVLLRAKPLVGLPDFARAHFFTWLWMQQRWARQKMTSKHWQYLSKAVLGDAFQRFQLPGRVDVSRVSGYLRLLRIPANGRHP